MLINYISRLLNYYFNASGSTDFLFCDNPFDKTLETDVKSAKAVHL